MALPQIRARSLTMTLMFAVVAGLQSCQSKDSTVTPVIVDDEGNMQPARDTMPRIMQSKLAHAQGILEGLALADFAQIEVNAAELVRISQQAGWMVHDTASYFSMSETFRAAAQAMVDDARRKDIAALSRDYGALTGSCVACHRNLQAERPTLDMPGRVSFAKTPSPFLMN